MMRVGIIGASGYTGADLARILVNHPDVELTVATSRQYAGKKLSEVFPHLREQTELVCENPAVDGLVEQADFFFTAVPHKTAMALVPDLLAAGKKVIDLSADYRLKDQAVYEAWYQKHSSPELLTEAVYGLPELYREQIKKCRLVANTGCYPASVILGLAPLLRNGLVDPATLIIDSKSGATGAGRSASVATLFCEVSDGFRAYKVGGVHRHTPEIDQELSLLADKPVTVSFTPHLLPINRGILSTIYAKGMDGLDQTRVQAVYEEYYEGETFVRVCPAGSLPATQHVRGSNYCDVGMVLEKRTGRIIVISAIDNLVRGSSGQAVQNMNLMLGLAEDAGLQTVPLFP